MTIHRPGPGAVHTAASIALWNAIVPKRIAAVKYERDAVLVLHPTKGWRRISHKRLALP